EQARPRSIELFRRIRVVDDGIGRSISSVFPRDRTAHSLANRGSQRFMNEYKEIRRSRAVAVQNPFVDSIKGFAVNRHPSTVTSLLSSIDSRIRIPLYR